MEGDEVANVGRRIDSITDRSPALGPCEHFVPALLKKNLLIRSQCLICPPRFVPSELPRNSRQSEKSTSGIRGILVNHDRGEIDAPFLPGPLANQSHNIADRLTIAKWLTTRNMAFTPCRFQNQPDHVLAKRNWGFRRHPHATHFISVTEDFGLAKSN